MALADFGRKTRWTRPIAYSDLEEIYEPGERQAHCRV